MPPEWKPLVDDWLRKVGYRLVPRRVAYPARVSPNGVLPLETWWENKGVAPCYEDFALALRLVGESRTLVRLTDARIPSWLPGDALYDGRVFLPRDMPEGAYELQLGIVDRQTREPRVRLAIEGRTPDGWYKVGPITVEAGPYTVTTERVLDTPLRVASGAPGRRTGKRPVKPSKKATREATVDSRAARSLVSTSMPTHCGRS